MQQISEDVYQRWSKVYTMQHVKLTLIFTVIIYDIDKKISAHLKPKLL